MARPAAHMIYMYKYIISYKCVRCTLTGGVVVGRIDEVRLGTDDRLTEREETDYGRTTDLTQPAAGN